MLCKPILRSSKRKIYMRRGQLGIGALVLFIAFVLTAAIAAFLITQTTVSTQQKAAAVADQARERAGTTFEIVRVEGITNANQTEIEKYIVYVRLAPGSSPINLNHTTLLYYTRDGREAFTYGGNVTDETNLTKVDHKFYILTAYTAGTPDNIFEAGEFYALGIRVNRTIKPSEWWRIVLVPKEGMPAEVYGIAPDVFTSQVVILR